MKNLEKMQKELFDGCLDIQIEMLQHDIDRDLYPNSMIERCVKSAERLWPIDYDATKKILTVSTDRYESFLKTFDASNVKYINVMLTTK